MNIELIPSAKRLIRSLRDIGYEFVDAVADVVDNAIEAKATVISINLKFDGMESYLTIADNGVGMASKEIQEALRFGSARKYGAEDDLGRYGLGLKTASLSQAEKLTVSARRGEERARINSYCWDLDHIEETNRWEILKVETSDLKDEIREHLYQTTGTVITWERLGRLLGYKYPTGEHAKKQADLMVDSLRTHLGMIFHRFLSGEIYGKRIAIYINNTRVSPWDPYSRGEENTQKMEAISIPVDYEDGIYNVKIQPYILPPQALYSSAKAHATASGPSKWNKQQGLYIYRSNRIIQAGGWCGLRTSDEHTKLIRVAVFIPPQLDELFQVNVAKKQATLPRQLRSSLLKQISPAIQFAQETYREKALTTFFSDQNKDTFLQKRMQINSQRASSSAKPNEAQNFKNEKIFNANQITKFIKKLPIDLQKATSIDQLKKIFIEFQETLDLDERKNLSSMLNKFLKKSAL